MVHQFESAPETAFRSETNVFRRHSLRLRTHGCHGSEKEVGRPAKTAMGTYFAPPLDVRALYRGLPGSF